MKITDQQFETLLRNQLDGTATSDQIRDLNQAMRDSPDRVRKYVSMRDIETMLEWELGFAEVNLSLPDLQNSKPAPKSRFTSMFGPALAAAAGLAVAFLAGTQVGGLSKPTNETHAEAVLFDSEDAVWEKNAGPRSFGAPFKKGIFYKLESGIARLAFANGAGLAIEGPARMKVVNGDRVEIFEGKIAAYVPDEAVGFVVATPGINIVDLGTKFGAEIKPDGASEVHVFEGQVEVEHEGSSGKRLIEAGEGLRYESDEPTSIAAREGDFAEPPSLEQLLSIGGESDRKTSVPNRSSLKQLSTNSDLLAFENFAIQPGEIDGQIGAFGFGKKGWKASRLHTQIVRSPDITDGGRLLIRGRQISEPNVVNRTSNTLASPLPRNFFIAFSGRYDGLDDDDFFAFWVDSADRQDSSHSKCPNLGIREGKFFARIGLEDTAMGPLATDGETFNLVAQVIRDAENGVATVKLWSSNFTGPPTAEVTAPSEWIGNSFTHLGLRMGKDSDVSDKLIVNKIAIGKTLEAVLIQP